MSDFKRSIDGNMSQNKYDLMSFILCSKSWNLIPIENPDLSFIHQIYVNNVAVNCRPCHPLSLVKKVSLQLT